VASFARHVYRSIQMKRVASLARLAVCRFHMGEVLMVRFRKVMSRLRGHDVGLIDVVVSLRKPHLGR